MVKYGIIDDDGKVIRWVFNKPSDHYQYITVVVPRKRKPKIDLSKFEEAPF